MVMGVDSAAQDVSREADSKKAESRRSSTRFYTRWTRFFAPTRLTSRIIIINVLGLVILVAGILYFNQTRKGLIAAREESLMIQAQIMAAAVASTAAANRDSFTIDPDLFLEQQLGAKNPAGSETYEDLVFPINPEKAGRVLRQLVSSTTTRARIFDRDGQMIVDSRHFNGRGEILKFDLPPINTPEPSMVVQMWTKFNNWLFANQYPLQKPYGLENGKDFSEIRLALTGLPVTKKAVNDKNEIIIIVAVPVQRFKAVQGALVLSTMGGEIDDVLKKERQVVLFTFAVAALVAILLSLSLAGHIAEPVRRLSAAAERIRSGVQNRVEIPDFTYRRDEVGHLSGALRDMTESLYSRIDAIEAFAADVSHEIKNPLTSLRSAVETLELAKTPEQRRRLIDVVNDDVKRLDRLITDISNASRLDAELVRAQAGPVDMYKVLDTITGIHRQQGADAKVAINFDVQKPRGRNSDDVFQVRGHENRLGQVVSNLLINALSFAPENSTVSILLRRTNDKVEFVVSDEGEGIPPENLEKIFKRFYTDRPSVAFGKNSGLGLSISRQIIESYRGTITAHNRADRKGARFVVVLPHYPSSQKPRDGSHAI